MKVILEDCPFCEGDAQLDYRVHRYDPTSHASDDTYVFVYCTSCGAKGPELYERNFSEFTDFTVEDFRTLDGLRDSEHKRHEKYKESLGVSAALNWNKRVTL